MNTIIVFAIALFFFLILIILIPPIRYLIVSKPVMKLLRQILPPIGDTERVALEAGTVWWDKELFSGRPEWKKMMSFPVAPLTLEEQMFVDGPVQKLCSMINDWEISQRWDLPPQIWSFLKEHKFFGMIIPKQYGGLGFSAQAHSAVVTKIASRSSAVAVTVMVPNSLGPAELLLHYGTEEQKDFYLPRLARGEEIPCFALTEPLAGSDAASLKSEGVVCNGIYEGKPTVGIRLTWDKRWITLAPVSTLIGLAFQLRDPEQILGGEKNIGITCALIPSTVEGVEIGKRHNTLYASFQNGPTRGKNVFIPLDFIIGGPKMAGQGWRMLMESLAAGRSISLPAMAVGNGKLALRTVLAHSKIREQFGLPIGKFEGVEEKISNMAGLLYVSEAGRTLTAAAVDANEKPSVISAVMKACTTENGRQLINDAMDIRAGSSITLGPKNPLGTMYMSVPISITVEGANILTRTLIIFGQGAIRCHPYVQKELAAIAANDVRSFDRAFFGHVFHVGINKARAMWMGFTCARFVCAPGSGHSKRVLQHLTRLSSAYAFLSDVCMGVMGGSLKRKEKISGRLADILSWLYFGAACVKKFKDDGQRPEDKDLFLWSTQYCLFQIQKAFYGVFENFTPHWIGWLLRKMLFPWGMTHRFPSDQLGHRFVSNLLDKTELKDRLSSGMYIPNESEEGLGFLEEVLRAMHQSEPIYEKIKRAVSQKIIDRKSEHLLTAAVQKQVITQDEKNKIESVEQLKKKAIAVDEFESTYFANTKAF